MDGPKGVLENAQEGKTKGICGWKFYSEDKIDPRTVIDYLNEAIEKQKEDKVLGPSKPKKEQIIPELLR